MGDVEIANPVFDRRPSAAMPQPVEEPHRHAHVAKMRPRSVGGANEAMLPRGRERRMAIVGEGTDERGQKAANVGANARTLMKRRAIVDTDVHPGGVGLPQRRRARRRLNGSTGSALSGPRNEAGDR